MQPFSYPVCTADGTIFDITHILPWIKKHGTNPVNGTPLKSDQLIKLQFAKNEEGEMIDPVTFKVLTNNTHIVAVKNTGNVFAYDTVERLNIKAKMWRDLVSDEEFSRKDLITLQDPQNLGSRNLTSFKYIREGISTLTPEQQRERSGKVNKSALGNGARVLNSESPPPSGPAPIGKYLQQPGTSSKPSSKAQASKPPPIASTTKSTPYNAALHTTGRAAASLTSTGLTPDTSSALALLSEEEYMLKPRRVKSPGFVRISTNLGPLTIQVLPEFAPKAVWNFIQLAKKGYYDGVGFHRNIKGFMIQGGDPTGTGKGGTSVWGKNFEDEFDGPNTHSTRGIVSMANKGKSTNSSQFFITYRAVPTLNRKHTVFGKVVEGLETLDVLERVEVSEKDKRPVEEISMKEVTVLVNPFEEYLKEKGDSDRAEKEKEMVERQGGREDDKTTWTGKRLSGKNEGNSVGRYVAQDVANIDDSSAAMEEWETQQPARKRVKAGGGFGNFDSW